MDEIEGLPPAVALQQQRGTPTTRSSVGSVTTLSNLLRMLYSRAGQYPPGQEHLEAEAFSPNTPEGACPRCHGLGRTHEVTEASMVPDPGLTIRERAVAAWPTAWGGQNLRDILTTLGIDVDTPWKNLPKKTRDWILFTDEQPVVPVYAGFDRAEVKRAIRSKMEPSYMGTFSSARRHVTTSFATTQSAMMKKRAASFMVASLCPLCEGKRLRREALSVTFEGLDIAEISQLPMKQLAELLAPYTRDGGKTLARIARTRPETAIVVERIVGDLCRRLGVVLDLGLGYLALERSTPTLSPGELSDCALPLRLSPTSLASSMSWTNPLPVSIRPIRKPCSGRSMASRRSATPCSSLSTNSMSCATQTGLSMSGQRRVSWEVRFSTAVRQKACGR